MNLCETGIGKSGAFLVRPVGRGHVTTHGVGREKKDVGIATGRQHHRVRGVRFDLTGDQVARNNTAGTAIDDHDVQHLHAREHPHIAAGNLATQCRVGTDQQLLSRLSARVERTRHLCAAKRAIIQEPAILPRKRHSLGDTLINNQATDLRQPVDVRLATAKIASLDRVIKQPVNAISITGIVLGGVDATLGGNTVRATRAVLKTETIDRVP